MFLGYPKGVKRYCLWCLKLEFKKCIISRHVVFDETKMAYKREVYECKPIDSSDVKKADIEKNS